MRVDNYKITKQISHKLTKLTTITTEKHNKININNKWKTLKKLTSITTEKITKNNINNNWETTKLISLTTEKHLHQ